MILRSLRASVRLLRANRRGTTLLPFVLSSMAVMVVVGAGVDYATLGSAKATYQSAADAAALAGAKEFRLGNAAVATIEEVAVHFATAALGADADRATIEPSVNTDEKTVTVSIAGTQPTYVMQLIGETNGIVSATATARVVGGTPICVIGLDEEAVSTVLLDKSARLEAPGCAVYSNSRKPTGLMAKQSATIDADFICTAGGKVSPGPGSFNPTPETDCPAVPDPLSERPQPVVGGCDHTGLVIESGSANLAPGTYCGGLTVRGGATVSMSPGIYVLVDGPLSVSGGAALTGTNVGVFLSGSGAVIDFAAQSTISLTAPKDGLLAGILAFEDRASPEGQVHQILSDDARTLLGTIYLPRNRLHVAANSPIADRSAYTIVVARLFTLSEGPTMVLNSNYDATSIPVPDGVGPKANKPLLMN